jgi:hypothetical protein
MKILLLTLATLSFTQTVFATELYCNDSDLKDLRTGEVVRTFPGKSTSDTAVNGADHDCISTLRGSVNELYCNGTELKELRTGKLVRTFPAVSNETAHDVDADCISTLRSVQKF